jgi:hypothetical protein
MVDKVKKAVSTLLGGVDKQSEQRMFAGTRATMASRMHFVPIQLGNIDVVKLTLEKFIQFPKADQDKLVEDYRALMQKKYDEQVEVDQETGQLKLKGNLKPKAGRSVAEEIRRIANDTIGSALGLTVFNFDNLKNELITYIKQRHGGRLVLSATNGWTSNGKILSKDELSVKLATHPCVVYLNSESDANIIGALYSSYSAVGSGLFTPFFNVKLATSKKFGNSLTNSGEIPSLLQLSDEYVDKISIAQEKAADDIRKTLGVDIGHLAGTSKSLQTVLQQKINDIREWVNTTGKNLLTPETAAKYNLELANANNKLLDQLRAGNKGVTYGDLIQDKLVELNILSRLEEMEIVVVIPQERYENQYFAGRKIEYVIAQELSKVIPEYRQSPSLIDRISKVLIDNLKTGKSSLTNYSKATKLQIKMPGIKRKLSPIKITTGNKRDVVNSGKLAEPRKTKPKPVTKVVDLPVSPVSIQNLINASLAETIKRNMGSGTRRDVLNLRSGRLAESAEIVKISESRTGAITAFYTYMKNPYATFSQGGKQQYPRSRDPKTLISKSIREIAQQLKINELRAVLV